MENRHLNSADFHCINYVEAPRPLASTAAGSLLWCVCFIAKCIVFSTRTAFAFAGIESISTPKCRCPLSLKLVNIVCRLPFSTTYKLYAFGSTVAAAAAAADNPLSMAATKMFGACLCLVGRSQTHSTSLAQR